MKQYVTHGTGSAQTLSEVQNTNVVVYDTMADAEADLTNLAEGQIIAIKDTGDELAQPVDTVQAGNLHAVTSNAVYNTITPDYANVTAKLASSGSFVADTDGWIACKLLGYSLGGDTSAEVQIYDDENAQSFVSACFAYISTGAIGTSSIVKVNKGNKIRLTIAPNFSNSGCVVYFIPSK